MTDEMFIIKYGGSRVSPTEDTYDNEFISDLAKRVQTHPNNKFLVIIGGGAKAREFQRKGEAELEKGVSIETLFDPDQDLIQQGNSLNPEDPKYMSNIKDLLGIKATRSNANYVIQKFKELGVENVCPQVVYNPTEKVQGDFRVYFAGGYRPGNSTDAVAINLALTYNAENVVKVSDFDVVKNVKPSEFEGLSKEERKQLLAESDNLPNMTWKQINDLVGDVWKEGMHTCLDPLAAKLGYENKDKLELYICEESQLENVFNKNEKDYIGTVVKN